MKLKWEKDSDGDWVASLFGNCRIELRKEFNTFRVVICIDRFRYRGSGESKTILGAKRRAQSISNAFTEPPK